MRLQRALFLCSAGRKGPLTPTWPCTPTPVGRGKDRRPEELQLLALASPRLKH